MKLLLLLPILIPLCAAALSLLAWRRQAAQRALAVAATALSFAAAACLLAAVDARGILAVQIGGWPAPFGITVVADLLSAVMAALAGLVGFSIAIYSLALTEDEHVALGFYPLLHVLLAGVSGAFLAGDIFNLYVWFEVMLISSFVLMALGDGPGQMEGAFKYVSMNILASAFFLSAVGILYAVTGTLNLADLSVKLKAAGGSPLVTTIAMMLLVAFGIKSALFPFFFWLPASYHTPPAPVAAVFAGLLTKVGVYSLIRVFTLLFVFDAGWTHGLLLLLAGLTMVTGVLGAVIQHDFRRVLSFHIVSQIGYMVMGLALFTPAGLAGSIFYIAHHVIVKTNLFLIGGAVQRMRGTGELRRLGGFYRDQPLWAALFLVPALSLAGVPPLSGFFAKLAVIRAGFAAEMPAVTAAALAVGLLTLFSMTKIFNEAFWKPAPDGERALVNVPWSVACPIVLLAAVTIVLGIWPAPLFRLARDTAEQLLNPSQYVAAVLGGGR